MTINTPDNENVEATSNNGVDTPVTDGSQKSEEDASTTEMIIIGMVADTKDVFAKFDADGNRSWSDKPPTDLEEAPENETTQKYAIIVRKSTSSKITLKEDDDTKVLLQRSPSGLVRPNLSRLTALLSNHRC